MRNFASAFVRIALSLASAGLMASLACACGGPQCPAGQVPVCQSGPKNGSQCSCVSAPNP